jgi:hypothetical protein
MARQVKHAVAAGRAVALDPQAPRLRPTVTSCRSLTPGWSEVGLRLGRWPAAPWVMGRSQGVGLPRLSVRPGPVKPSDGWIAAGVDWLSPLLSHSSRSSRGEEAAGVEWSGHRGCSCSGRARLPAVPGAQTYLGARSVLPGSGDMMRDRVPRLGCGRSFFGGWSRGKDPGAAASWRELAAGSSVCGRGGGRRGRRYGRPQGISFEARRTGRSGAP